MEIKEKIDVFVKQMKSKYDLDVVVTIDNMTADNPVVVLWMNAIARYFKTEPKRCLSGKYRGCHEKMWLQYFLVEKEMIPHGKIKRLFPNSDRTSIYYNVKACKGFKDVYPDVYAGIVEEYMSIYTDYVKHPNNLL